MVIIIGAESCTGKTLMAQKLLEIYKIPYLSVDHLKMGLYRADTNCDFTPTDSNELIESRLWPIIKGIIDTNIENKQNIIIEGCYIFPNRLSEFDKEYFKQIIPVFMGFTKKYVENHFISGILKYRSIIELREEEEERTSVQIIAESEKLKSKCSENGVKYFEIDEDYAKDTDIIYRWIAKEASKIMRNTPIV